MQVSEGAGRAQAPSPSKGREQLWPRPALPLLLVPVPRVCSLLPSSRPAPVRECAAQLLLSLVERIGVTQLAGTPRAERLPHVAGKLAQDCHKDTSNDLHFTSQNRKTVLCLAVKVKPHKSGN